MTHPLFKKEIFVETAFARRFQKMLQDAWDNRSWHLLVADPGAGKTMSIRDLQKRAGGRSVLAVVAPKNNDDEQALGDQFLAALGLPIRGHWSTRKPKLMGHLHQYGTEFLIVDDAHDLSLEHGVMISNPENCTLSQLSHLSLVCLLWTCLWILCCARLQASCSCPSGNQGCLRRRQGVPLCLLGVP